jgi:hypothetical protein
MATSRPTGSGLDKQTVTRYSGPYATRRNREPLPVVKGSIHGIHAHHKCIDR